MCNMYVGTKWRCSLVEEVHQPLISSQLESSHEENCHQVHVEEEALPANEMKETSVPNPDFDVYHSNRPEMIKTNAFQ